MSSIPNRDNRQRGRRQGPRHNQPQPPATPHDPLYALTIRGFFQQFAREGFAFWMICGYLVIEYVRPQSILPGFDILPWGQIFIIGAMIGLASDRNRGWVSDRANTYITFFLVALVLSSIFAEYPEISRSHWFDFVGWFIVYFLIINTVTTERRFFIFLAIFLLASFKLSFFGARTWAMRGFAFADWGLAGPPGPFQNSGELSIQMLVATPIGLYLAKFIKPYVSRLKYWLVLLVPITSVMTVLGASSRGAQLGLVAQTGLEVLKRKNPVKLLVLAAIVGVVGYQLLPDEQKARFETAGEDETSIQRMLYWKHGVEMIKDNPVLGVGFYNFAPYYFEHHREDILFGRAQLPHNIFVQVGTDAGLLGLVFFVLLLYRNFSCAWQIRKLCRNTERANSLPALVSQGTSLAMVGYIIAGQFVTVAYYPFLWINLAMSVALLNIARKQAGGGPGK